jgi:hypothetical protein
LIMHIAIHCIALLIMHIANHCIAL